MNTKLGFDQSTSKYRLSREEIARKGIKSVLFIKNVNQDDYANYTCKGSNEHGNAFVVVQLEPEG